MINLDDYSDRQELYSDENKFVHYKKGSKYIQVGAALLDRDAVDDLCERLLNWSYYRELKNNKELEMSSKGRNK